MRLALLVQRSEKTHSITCRGCRQNFSGGSRNSLKMKSIMSVKYGPRAGSFGVDAEW
jgi:hypothetical protein